jgi:hypothetical protein
VASLPSYTAGIREDRGNKKKKENVERHIHTSNKPTLNNDVKM